MTESKASPNTQEIRRDLWFAQEIYARWVGGKDEFALIAPYEYELCGRVITIPRGFRCNGASIPNWLHSVIFISPFHYTVRRAGLVHDYLYSTGYNRKKADLIYLDISKEDGANLAQAYAMYYALRLFGGFAYRKCQEVRNG